AAHFFGGNMTSLVSSIGTLLLRELVTLRKEIEAYPSDADLWRTVPGISNSGGTLALHLTGNLQHFIGGVLGQSGYVRNRDAEFGSRDVPREELLRQVDATIASVAAALHGLDPARLQD